MKICVFGASSAHIDDKYIQVVEKLGEEMAKRGHSLVFGCGGTGLMGAAARGVRRGGGYIHGVVPTFFKQNGVEILFDECDKVTYTQTMRERKAIMEDDADAFIIVPGGVGTFEEFFVFMRTACERKFITKTCLTLYKVFGDIEDVLGYLENYVPQALPFSRTKLGD